MYVFVSEDHILASHPCSICYPLEIKFIELFNFLSPSKQNFPYKYEILFSFGLFHVIFKKAISDQDFRLLLSRWGPK